MMPNKDSEAQSPVAIITGGTTGIGAACAKELAERGYDLALVALSDPDNLTAQLEESGIRVEFFPIDISKGQESAHEIIFRTASIFGRIDLLINSAGVALHKEFTDVDDADWERIFAVNLKAPYFLIQQAYEYLKETGGSVINISSTNSFRPQRKNMLYDSLKAALNNMTAGFALEFRDTGVRVNAVAPGGVRTPLVEQWLRDYLGREPVEADYESPSIATPIQIAKVVVALANKDLGWINGVTIPVDGGFGL